ncbi:hypothetical protein BTO30_09260 [Domibacillus antri]|uniref:Uncharacterized protein n=1 Tax=Domibacillus antri TaxID=1714264 RepID=A0A1Q8Q557_9BACI|nr:DUF6501 family protein [Domibacillus antri]OLN22484.1 hypothetical protein BTO30_09260 [Domibacillus antri]
MIHTKWQKKETLKKVKCIHTNAEKYMVKNVLTEGTVYDVKNETEEFYFVVDNKGHISGFYKDYFQEMN